MGSTQLVSQTVFRIDAPLVWVLWADAYGVSAGWQTLSELKPVLLKVNSVGWVEYEDEDILVLVPHIVGSTPNTVKQGCGDMTIPKTAIISRREL